MGIVDWFTNKLETEERVLVRDLISIAIADKEFSSEEQQAILEICEVEDITKVELMDAIRDGKTGSKVLHTLDEKKRFILHLVRVMSADEKYPELEMHIIEIIAKKLDLKPLQIVAFVLDEIEDKNIRIDEGITIAHQFVNHLLTSEA